MKNKNEQEEYMTKNFLLINLEEKRTKKIAEIISNSTCKKIIDHLTIKDATESEISKELNIPISTVHYNLKQLVDSGLVVIEEFHYSKRGKEVNHYKLANKYIIIAPKTDDNSSSRFMEALKSVLPITIITAGVSSILYGINRLSFNMSHSFSKASEETTLMAAKSFDAQMVTVSSPPATQSGIGGWIIVGVFSVLIIYFLYEWVKKKN